jgi:hypothetical protein
LPAAGTVVVEIAVDPVVVESIGLIAVVTETTDTVAATAQSKVVSVAT